MTALFITWMRKGEEMARIALAQPIPRPAKKSHRAGNVRLVTIEGVDLFFVTLSNDLAAQFKRRR